MINHHKVFGIIGIVVLLIAAIIHGSGIGYITNLTNASNLNEFIKGIFPILFIHPTIHLVSMAAIALYGLKFNHNRSLLKLLSVLIALDSLLAFYLNEIAPALILLSAAVCLFMAGHLKKSE